MKPAAIIAALIAGLTSPLAMAQQERPAANSCSVDVSPQRLPRLVLDIAVTCAVSGDLTLRSTGSRMGEFVKDVRDSDQRPIDPIARDWSAAATDGMARLSYRFELDNYLEQADRVTTGLRRGDTRLALLDAWLLQPLSGGLALPLAITVRQTPNIRFATGLRYSAGAWRLPDVPVRFAGYTVFGGFKLESVAVPAPGSLAAKGAGSASSSAAQIDVVIMDGALDVPLPHLTDWVRQSAAAVANYFDGYSDQTSLLVVLPTAGSGVPFGRVVPGGGISMVILVGQSAAARSLYSEWVLIHEMIHTAIPFIYGRGTWLMEGAATYLEPIIRHRAGWKSEADVWREWIDNMDRGLPALTEIGLRNGGSPYWGGALFMLLADIEIRRATNLDLGLEDCFRGVLLAGANGVERWSVEEMLATCDRLIGKPVMATLSKRHVEGTAPLSLPTLWRELGVELRDGIIVYDDRAPLASIRDLIVKGPMARRGRLVPMGRN